MLCHCTQHNWRGGRYHRWLSVGSAHCAVWRNGQNVEAIHARAAQEYFCCWAYCCSCVCDTRTQRLFRNNYSPHGRTVNCLCEDLPCLESAGSGFFIHIFVDLEAVQLHCRVSRMPCPMLSHCLPQSHGYLEHSS